MQYINYYNSPIGRIIITADETALAGLWFDSGKCFVNNAGTEYKKEDIPVLKQAVQWLDIYFSGKEPDFTPPLNLSGTPFQLEVWKILQKIPYGSTITYGEVAKEIAKKRGIKRMSAQAAGGATGRNKIAIIIPCHRVVGAGGNLTGYAGGIDKKIKLLAIEKNDMGKFFVPKKKQN